MFEKQTPQSRQEEIERCRDWSWFSEEDEKRFGSVPQPLPGKSKEKPDNQIPVLPVVELDDPIEIGSKVYLGKDQLVGLVSKILPNFW